MPESPNIHYSTVFNMFGNFSCLLSCKQVIFCFIVYDSAIEIQNILKVVDSISYKMFSFSAAIYHIAKQVIVIYMHLSLSKTCGNSDKQYINQLSKQVSTCRWMWLYGQ